MEWMSFVIKVITMRLYDVVIAGPEVVFYRQCGSAETSNFIYSVFCFKAFVWRPALRALAATAAIYQPALMCFSRGFSVFGKPPQSRLKPGGRSALRHQGCLVVNHHSFKQISITIRAGAAAVAEDLDRRHDANWACPNSRASLLGVWPQVEASLMCPNWAISSCPKSELCKYAGHHWRSNSAQPQLMSLVTFWHIGAITIKQPKNKCNFQGHRFIHI